MEMSERRGHLFRRSFVRKKAERRLSEEKDTKFMARSPATENTAENTSLHRLAAKCNAVILVF
jgi:hypothetical protein